MSDNIDFIRSKQLYELMLPGTHNSCAYKVNYSIPTKFSSKLFDCLVPIIGPCFISKWVLNQTKNIKEQLNHGIRTLDIRISYNKQFYISHTFGLSSIESFFSQVKEFLRENPTEIVVILAKADYDNRESMNAVVERNFLGLVLEQIGSLLIRPGSDLTVSSIMASAKNIYFSYSSETELGIDWSGGKNTQIYSKELINRVWLNAKSVEEFQQKYLPIMMPKMFNIIDAVITPDEEYIRKNICGPSTINLSNKINDIILGILNRNERWSCILCDNPNDTITKEIILKNF